MKRHYLALRITPLCILGLLTTPTSSICNTLNFRNAITTDKFYQKVRRLGDVTEPEIPHGCSYLVCRTGYGGSYMHTPYWACQQSAATTVWYPNPNYAMNVLTNNKYTGDTVNLNTTFSHNLSNAHPEDLERSTCTLASPVLLNSTPSRKKWVYKWVYTAAGPANVIYHLCLKKWGQSASWSPTEDCPQTRYANPNSIPNVRDDTAIFACCNQPPTN